MTEAAAKVLARAKWGRSSPYRIGLIMGREHALRLELWRNEHPNAARARPERLPCPYSNRNSIKPWVEGFDYGFRLNGPLPR